MYLFDSTEPEVVKFCITSLEKKFSGFIHFQLTVHCWRSFAFSFKPKMLWQKSLTQSN